MSHDPQTPRPSRFFDAVQQQQQHLQLTPSSPLAQRAERLARVTAIMEEQEWDKILEKWTDGCDPTKIKDIAELKQYIKAKIWVWKDQDISDKSLWETY